MKQQSPSNPPTVELSHEHITTLRDVNDDIVIDQVLGAIHRQFLRGEYNTAEFGRALVDDLTLTEAQTKHLIEQLRAYTDERPMDVIEYLTSELDDFHQIAFSHRLKQMPEDGADGHVIVADGGVPTAPLPEHPPEFVREIIRLRDGDRVCFGTKGELFCGSVDSTRWDTTAGGSHDDGFEVASASIDLDSDLIPFSSSKVILHAARGLTESWRVDEPVVIDAAEMTDYGQLDYLSIDHGDSESDS